VTNTKAYDWTVVVVDDDPDSSELVARLLERHACRTITFVEGRDAVLYAMHHPFDVAIVDLQMSGMDGASVAHTMRKFGASKHAALIALSGVVDPHWEVVRHFDAYLRKPVEPRRLAELVITLASIVRDQTVSSY
jgi:CheY-like chemotaxis protein